MRCPACQTGPTRSLTGYDARACECGRRIWTGIEEAEYAAKDRRPHSRACGLFCQGHGSDCATDCPTCHGRPLPAGR